VARQVTKVLRLKAGDRILLLDGVGGVYESVIAGVAKDSIEARVLGRVECANEPSIRLTLALCLPKGDKLEMIVQKGTELGVCDIALVHSQRTVSRPDAAGLSAKITRWRKIASEAAEQSGRAVAPDVHGVLSMADLAEMIPAHDLAIVAWEEEGKRTLRQTLEAARGASSVMLIIGPEGGLTQEEVEMLTVAGAESVSLGRRVLRTETAAIGAVSAIMYEMEGEL